MFERMEIVEALYEEGAPSKNTQGEEAYHSISERKKKGGVSASPSNPYQGRADKRKINDAGHMSDAPTGAKNTCLLHGPNHPSEECKVLK